MEPADKTGDPTFRIDYFNQWFMQEFEDSVVDERKNKSVCALFGNIFDEHDIDLARVFYADTLGYVLEGKEECNH
jgi:hypothetical protein